YGHYSGDECLRLVANMLKSSIRNTDQVGRFGGEEFITILPETKLGEAIDLGERLRHLIVCLCPKFENQVINLSVSIGVTNYHKNDETLDDVLRRADKALYSAKDQGRNRIVSL
ncbi:MAG: GGDEF domain-containing protein, partial [Microcystaceae cyanobacterium]